MSAVPPQPPPKRETQAPAVGELDARPWSSLPGDFSYGAVLNDSIPYSRLDVMMPRLREGFSAEQFNSLAEFSSGAIAFESRPARIYQAADLPTNIVVPEEYAVELDRVDRKLSSIEPPALRPTLPEHAAFVLRRLPDRGSSIARLYLLNEANPADPWFRHAYNNPEFSSAAATDLKGNISLFESVWTPRTADRINHEWAHEQVLRWPQFAVMQNQAVRIEQGCVLDPYANTSPAERWAVHLEELMSQTAHAAAIAAMDRPIELSVLGRALRKIIEASGGAPGEINDAPLARVRDVEKEVQPDAEDKLHVLQHLGSLRERFIASGLLDWLAHS